MEHAGAYELALLAMQAFWGLLLLALGFILKRLARDLELHSSSISALAKAIADNHLETFRQFVQKPDWDQMRERYHAINNDVVALKTRDSFARELAAYIHRAGGHHETPDHHP